MDGDRHTYVIVFKFKSFVYLGDSLILRYACFLTCMLSTTCCTYTALCLSGQKRASGALKLELLVVMSLHVGAGD